MRLGGIFIGFFGVVAICVVSTLSAGNSNLGSFEYYALFLVGVICQGLALGEIGRIELKVHSILEEPQELRLNRPKEGRSSLDCRKFRTKCNRSYMWIGLLLHLMTSQILGLIIDFQWPSNPFPKHYAWFPILGTWQGLLVIGWLSIASGVIGFMCYFFLVARIGGVMHYAN